MRIANIIHASLFTPGCRGNWGLPLMCWGPPGPGKTDTIEGVGWTAGLETEVLSPGERGEAAFGVIPVPEDVVVCEVDAEGDTKEVTKRVITNPAPEWTLRFAKHGGRGLVFMDETNTAPPAIQPAMMGAIHARRIGGTYLGPGVRVIGAGNPVAASAGGYELAPPVANRMGHLDWPDVDVDAWCSWLTSSTGDRGKFGDAAAEEERVMKQWGAAFARAKGFVIGFMKARRTKDGLSHLYAMPKPNDPKAGRAWPSPRTWELATRAYAGSIVHSLDGEDSNAFVAAFVGDGPATEFFAYVRENDLPLPEDVLDGKVKFEHNPRRLDRSMAVLSACAALLTPTTCPNRAKRSDKMWEIITNLLGTADDLVVLNIKAMSDAKLTKTEAGIAALLASKGALQAAKISK